MTKIKVAVVDDSAFMRKIVTDCINTNNEMEVVAKFRNGKDLLEQVDRYNPDIITLDIEMPVLNGLETLKALKELGMKYPVIMLSSLTSQNSVHTLECLELGAMDFVEKPSGSLLLSSNEFKDTLIQRISEIGKSRKNSNNTVIIPKRIDPVIKKRTSQIKAIIIGASTGGPRALQAVLTKIDGDIGVPVFVVQHMPKGFTKAFADRLNGICKLKTVEAEDNMLIEKNTIYIAPGGCHMTVGSGDRIKNNEEPSIWGVRPAVDKLFESAVKVYGGNLLSVILTGMGKDGSAGTVLVKDAGGITISEDESTCTIYGMPKVAYETGKVDIVLPLPDIPGKINSIVKGR
ncbi:protein-glutamate methylesterase/protein-glutamine glutaminase [Clostridium vincentii]|uniref:Protein-glutamate methylesterase/protein-glutamine glutaminase n=1 Tax=Clostridium vincentii TaxID=52704 RepID=A0A2T0BG58_9CLOT|nr:chemotaxis response regulator protein-glutamate methylesterase [Clostridium vincentii]PRR82823.1 Chemotaxis response regulator protein-glutamate methylesterase [Clostridium vincentii]